MPIEIKHVDPQGTDALALLMEASVDARALYPELFSGSTKVATNEALTAGAIYLVAYLDGQALACGAFRPLSPTVAELRRIYVHRDHRRKGLARAVLQRLEEEAVRMSYHRLVLETGHKQLPAMRLYEACGFENIPAFGEYLNDPTSVCYGRTIAPEA
ncbi:GNAT family N-acetyltransferase [Kinneretia aquatilis]|uniref:GNAT family N-acetyltransferase n=1 Tax=Kinneretia aquatilis TaxID=2070761 RepID=UPI00149540D1|nr:GNAT family N-acetyltransferase [Paucibacter aquatile]WIV97904.1 GNAT family N-acetyltransferase [Paucibacter aquatile]